MLKSLNCNTVLISCKNSDSLPVDDLKKYLSDIQGFFYDTKNSNIEINSIKDSGVSVSTSVTPVDKDKIDTNYDRYESREEEIKTHKYVGNRNTYLFYDNTNPIVKTISDGNITYFEDKLSAEANGFKYMPMGIVKSTSGFDIVELFYNK